MVQQYGRFRVTKQIGEGGMGVVYAAHDDQLDRPVAIKTWRSQGDASARGRLLREARAAASVSHPNICQLYDFGEHEGEVYIAMELLEGESLAARIARGALSAADAIQIELPVLAALDALHRRGLVHRDLKPSNIFLTPFGVKLLDFGLAVSTDAPVGDAATRPVTIAGTLMGTPQYLAPEQLRGEPADHRTDLFAAGGVLYEMLTGTPAFGAGARTIAQVFHAILTDHPPALGGSVAIAAVDRVIHRALQKNPAQRYESALAMADDLRAALTLVDTGQVAQAHRLRRLIVLPFRVLRPDAETDFLAFSLADAITSSLSNLNSLVVRSSVTASRFAADVADLETVAAKADVDLVLTGTLLRAGGELRVNTQLVEAPAGRVVCSYSSQAALGDIFTLQDALSHRIVEALALPLATEEQRLRRDVPATAKAYEYYLRANELSTKPHNWTVARNLYLECVAEDPNFAPAWARLGRVNRVLAVYSGESADEYYEQARNAFTRALTLNPDLPVAHNLYTNLEVELGHAEAAMLRLVRRAHDHTGDPELFAGLVQACRYCGLLEPAIAAFEHARRLDPHIRTSVAHAYFALGDYEQTMATNVEDPPVLNALAMVALGRSHDAAALLREVDRGALPKLYRLYVQGTLGLIEGKRAHALESLRTLRQSSAMRDPCGWYYAARAFAYLGDHDIALESLERSVSGGFVCVPWLTRDPWMDSLRQRPQFRALLADADARHRRAADAFVKAGGDRLLGGVSVYASRGSLT